MPNTSLVQHESTEAVILGPLGNNVLRFRSISGKDELGQLFEYTVTMLSERFDVSIEEMLGKLMTVRIGSTEAPRYFNGLVTRFCITGQVGRYASYKAVLRPQTWLLSRSSGCRIFNDMSVMDIIKEVCLEYSLLLENGLTETGAVLPYCVQYRETDLNFVMRLMQHEGIYMFFRHKEDRHVMVLVDVFSAPSTEALIVDYLHNASQQATPGDHAIESWSSEGEIQTSHFVHNDFNYERFSSSSNQGLLVKTQPALPFKQSNYEKFDYPGGYLDAKRGKTVVDAQGIRHEGLSQQIKANTTGWKLATGSVFTLINHPRPDQNINYLVTATQYHIQSNDTAYEAQSNEQFQCQCNIEAIDNKFAYLPQQLAMRSMVQGPQTATVVGPKGEEIHTDHLGRIKVKFHWERERWDAANSDEEGRQSCWVRVAQVWAGKGWGGFFIPRIGQEVMVSFLDGDPDRPLVTGSVYNSDMPTPFYLPKYATRSTIKSNSSPGGGGFNEIRFEDKKGAEQLFSHAEKDLESYVKNDTVEWVGNDRHLVVSHDQMEQVGGDKHVDVKGARNEKIGNSASLETGKDMHIKTGNDYAIDAGMNLHIKAGMNLILEAGAMISLKVGSSFITLDPAMVAISGTPINLNSGGAAGNGSGASPIEPKAPKVADDGKIEP